jgi:hypothetical protein
MKRASVILIGVILMMNIANAFGDVSYHTARVDDLDIFYREAGSKDGPTISAPTWTAVISPDVRAAVGVGLGRPLTI